MNTIKKEIKNKDNTSDIIFAKSDDNYDVMVNDNYKLIKLGNNKSKFSETILGSDIGIHSHGFISVVTISLIITIILVALMYSNFRI